MPVALDRHIEQTNHVRGGKPRLAGTRLAVADIVIMNLRLGMAPEQIADKHQVSLAAVHAALAYYYDHRADIDRSIQEDDEYARQFQSRNVSPLQQKLRELNGD